MTDPVFLSFEQVLAVHDRSLALYGGSSGIRNEGLLRSAVDQPLNDHFYGRVDAFGIAAAYGFHIAQAQAFIDGNKRTAIAVALAFLELNGISTPTNTAVLYDAMIGIAERRVSKSDLARFFRELFS